MVKKGYLFIFSSSTFQAIVFQHSYAGSAPSGQAHNPFLIPVTNIYEKPPVLDRAFYDY